MKLRKRTEAIIITISILILFWIGISWIEIISKNLDPNPTYSAINFFVLLIKGA